MSVYRPKEHRICLPTGLAADGHTSHHRLLTSHHRLLTSHHGCRIVQRNHHRHTGRFHQSDYHPIPVRPKLQARLQGPDCHPVQCARVPQAQA